jgi:hypothetical protein
MEIDYEKSLSLHKSSSYVVDDEVQIKVTEDIVENKSFLANESDYEPEWVIIEPPGEPLHLIMPVDEDFETLKHQLVTSLPKEEKSVIAFAEEETLQITSPRAVCEY